MNKGTAGSHRLAGFGLAVAFFLLSFSGTSQAQVATAEQRAACTPDAFRLCAGEIPNIPAITACMRKNRENLSPACRAVFPK